MAEGVLPPGKVEPPGAPPRPWRLSGRLLVLDPDDRVLLVRSRDPSYPELGQWWEVPGGGVDPGEDTVGAALREVAEETGFRVGPADVQPGVWRIELTYLWLGTRRWSRQAVHLARLSSVPPAADALQYTPEEEATFLGAEWVSAVALDHLSRTFPDGVQQILGSLSTGEEVDAGFAVWC